MSSLGEVLFDQVNVGYVISVGLVSRIRRVNDPVRQRTVANDDGLEEFGLQSGHGEAGIKW